MTQQEDDLIIFQEIPKDGMQSASVSKQPIPGDYVDLHDELEKKCNPANFMHPYNREKIDMANDIYHQITLYHTDDNIELIRLRKRAMQELGIRFSTIKLYNKLTQACNPENFTGDNYDAQKLKLANAFYSQILENADDIEKLEEIEQEAFDFIEIAEKRQREIEIPQKRVNEDIDWQTVGYFCVFFLFFLFIIFSIIATHNNSPY